MSWDLSLVLYVVVGVVVNAQKELLVTQRPLQKSYSGYWEFPGGKKEAEETPQEALVRELKEELDINVLTAEPWQQMEYAYPEKLVFLDLWIVREFTGQPQGMENQAFQWVALDQLNAINFLPANKMMLAAVIEKFR